MRFSLITLTLSLALPLAASATTYNVVTSFSTALPQSGPLTYGYGTPTSFTAYSYAGTNFGPGYGFNYLSSGGDSLPAAGIDAPGAPYGTVNLPAGNLFMHPGQANDLDSIVQFTAPTAGTYAVDVTFAHDDIDNSGTGQIVGVYVNGLDKGSMTLTTTYLDSFAFTGDFTLLAGGTIDLDVAKNGNLSSSYEFDSTGLTGTISSVTATPEPSSLVLLGTGILGLAGAARRKIRS